MKVLIYYHKVMTDTDTVYEIPLHCMRRNVFGFHVYRMITRSLPSQWGDFRVIK